MAQSTRFFYEQDEEAEDYTVYEANSQLKRKIAKPEMSVAKYACSTPNKKLFFGKPNPLLMIEDLAHRLSLKELEDIMGDVMQTYYDEGLDKNAPPAEHPIDIHHNLVQIAMKNYTDKLYGNQLIYSASMLRKCAKLYKETTMTIDNHLVQPLKK